MRSDSVCVILSDISLAFVGNNCYFFAKNIVRRQCLFEDDFKKRTRQLPTRIIWMENI